MEKNLNVSFHPPKPTNFPKTKNESQNFPFYFLNIFTFTWLNYVKQPKGNSRFISLWMGLHSGSSRAVKNYPRLRRRCFEVHLYSNFMTQFSWLQIITREENEDGRSRPLWDFFDSSNSLVLTTIWIMNFQSRFNTKNFHSNF